MVGVDGLLVGGGVVVLDPGVDPERVRERTGWSLRISDSLTRTEPPTMDELATLRRLVEGSGS